MFQIRHHGHCRLALLLLTIATILSPPNHVHVHNNNNNFSSFCSQYLRANTTSDGLSKVDGDSQSHGYFGIVAATATASILSTTIDSVRYLSWTWISGSNQTNTEGVCIALDAPENVPAARSNFAYFHLESQNVFYMFGGERQVDGVSGRIDIKNYYSLLLL